MRDTLRSMTVAAGIWLAMAAVPVPTQATDTFYVSLTGDDGNPGTLEAPFRSIGRAQAAVRPLTGGMTGDITVLLRGGTYQLAETVRFDQHDSGMNGFRVVYRSFPGERAALSGGRRIAGWMPADDGVFHADAEGARFRQLYVNGRRATRARMPNAPEFARLVRWDEPSQRIVVPAAPVASWADPSVVELVVLKQWTQNNLRLDSVMRDAEGLFVLPREPERTNAFNGHLFLRQEGQSYYFENALELLDAPGEWYLRAPADQVFYKPREGEDLADADVIVPHTERLLAIQGTVDEPVHHLAFLGLTFEYAGWTAPSEEGFVVSQAEDIVLGSSGRSGRIGTAVTVTHAHHIRLERNTFRHLGGTALGLTMNVSDTAVIGNHFRDLSAGGIAVDGLLAARPGDPRLVCRDILIANNLIRDIGVEYRSSVGIFAGFVFRTRIEHNEIYDAPYTGISLGWGWTDEATSLGDNRIAGNRIGRVMALMADGGGIYTLSKQPGTVISGNYVHDLVRSPWTGEFPIAGIYLDEGSSEILVSDNVLERAPLGILFHRASRNLIVNTDGSYEERNGAAENVLRLEAGFAPEAVKSRAGLEAAYADVAAAGE